MREEGLEDRDPDHDTHFEAAATRFSGFLNYSSVSMKSSASTTGSRMSSAKFVAMATRSLGFLDNTNFMEGLGPVKRTGEY